MTTEIAKARKRIKKLKDDAMRLTLERLQICGEIGLSPISSFDEVIARLRRNAGHAVILKAAKEPRLMGEALRDGTVILAELEPGEWSLIEWAPGYERWCRFEDEELVEVHPRRFLDCPPEG